MRIHASDPDEPVVNLTPMIDVIFTLLVFFMLATTFLERERLLDLELPTATSPAQSPAGREELVINIARGGQVWIDGRELDGESLSKVLSDAAHRDPRVPVTVRGDRRVYHEEVVRVLDHCLRAGLANVAVSTREDG